MRAAIWLLGLAVLVAAEVDQSWVEEEDLYDDNYEQDNTEELAEPAEPDEEYTRVRRSTYEEPDTEYIRVKRRCYHYEEPVRTRRSADYNRVPRQVRQYEVHEHSEDNSVPLVHSYDEMLAASAEHYHQVHAKPGAPHAARYLNPDVSRQLNFGVRPAPSNYPFNVYPANNPTSQPVRFTPGYVNVSQKPVYVQSAPNHPRPVKYVPREHQPAHYSHVISQPVQYVPAPENILHAPEKILKQPTNIAHHNNPVYVSSDTPLQLTSKVKVAPIIAVNANHNPVPEKVGEVPRDNDNDVPLASVPLTLQQQLAHEDSAGAAAGHHKKHHKHSHGHSQGGGQKKHAHHHANHGGKSVKGYKNDQHVHKGGKGHKTDENHRKEYEEAAGQKKKHHDHADHKGSHEEQAHGHKGSKFDEKKGHKKGHKTKGYHNKYHKDEFHKEHKFYDDYHKSGEHHRYGKFHAKHASNEGGKKKAHHVNAGHDFVEHGKKGYTNKGHLDADHKGYKGKDGHEEHHEHHSEHGKKGGKEGSKKWGYAKTN